VEAWFKPEKKSDSQDGARHPAGKGLSLPQACPKGGIFGESADFQRLITSFTLE